MNYMPSQPNIKDTNKALLKEMIKKSLFKTLDDKERIRLSSGKLSKYYFDIRRVSCQWYPAKLIAYAYSDVIEQYASSRSSLVVGVGGLEVGAIPIIMSLVLEYQLPGFWVRKEPKKYGMKQQIEGELPNHVILVDDIVTSGKSILRCVDAITKARHNTRIIGVFPLIDRNKELENYDLFFQLWSKGIVYEPIFSSFDFINNQAT